jgi:propanol-preferring alcohol dehydrogenase
VSHADESNGPGGSRAAPSLPKRRGPHTWPRPTRPRSLGCVWAGGSDERPGTDRDAAIIFAPVGDLVPLALEAVRKGGTVVLGGIHMSEIPAMPYRLLWGERTVRSVANLTQQDAQEFLAIAGRTPIRTEVVPYALADANTALRHLREGQLTGAAVLVPERDA